MHSTEKAGNLLPKERPNVDALIEAVSHLQLAYEAISLQEAFLDPLPPESKDKWTERLENLYSKVIDDYDATCSTLCRLITASINPSPAPLP